MSEANIQSKTNIQSPYIKLRDHLKSIREYEKFIELLSANRTISEKFAEIWNRKDLVKIIDIIKVKASYKNDKFSEQFLIQGNRLCSERKLSKALSAYNYAVLAALDSKALSRKDEKDVINSLVMAYATRSALLFDMEQYAESIRDIDRAIKHGYPLNKVQKIEQRRIKCLLHMNKTNDAEKRIRTLLEEAKLANEAESLANLENLLLQCNIKGQDAQANSSLGATTIVDLFQRGSEIPLFLKKYNKDEDINVISRNIKVNYMPSKGRHLIATKDIKPGEILMVEKAFCSVPKLNGNHLRLFCCVCLRKATVPLPCDNCSLVSFCSDDCLMSKHNNHSIECSLLPTLVSMKVDEELGLVVRTLLKFTMEDILSELESAKDSTAPLSGPKEAKLFLHSPTTYRTLTKLEGNLGKRSGESMLDSIANAVLGVNLLQTLPSFWERKNKCDPPIEQTSETLSILGCELTKLLLNFQCNIHCIKELQIDPEQSVVCAGSFKTGYGVYKAFSLMNHSCVPNVLHSSWGDVKFLYSITFIPKGEEILDSYGERYVSHSLADRKCNLRDTYYFDCQCQACINNWPLYPDIPDSFTILVCPICHRVMDNTIKKCQSCEILSSEKVNKKNSVTNASKTSNRQEMKNEFSNAKTKYDACVKKLNHYQTSFANIKHIGNYISLLAKHTNIPNKPIIAAQEELLRCFDLMGAFSYKGYNLYKEEEE